MTIAASGAVSLEDLRTEFVGGSSAISLGDLYRGGSNILAKAGNNTATNLAAAVPSSGVIDVQDFYGTAKGFRKTYTSGATNQDASSVFGSDYGVNYPKEIVINSGVELGATSTSQEALQINSGLSGSMTITNNGTLSGAGGSAGGGAGGDAFEANVACTLINNGTIRGGGGGGGNGGNGGTGGTGGQGRTTYSYYGSWISVNIPGSSQYVNYNVPGGTPNQVRNVQSNNYRSNNGTRLIGKSGVNGGGSTLFYYNNGANLFHAGPTSNVANIQMTQVDGNFNNVGHGGGSAQYRQQLTGYNYHNGGSGGGGGAGGSGGRGQGYNHGNQNGSGGSAGAGGAGGGSNAGAGGQGGTGGTGGNGGTYGNGGGNGSSGATGNTGASGNHTGGSGGSGGSSGSGGGAAGKYIRGLSNVTFTNNGTVQGGTA